ncbi:hypothetical protein FRUB_04904 [Fimbriiglobus ruber]|uniref:Uncharacterized protein n=1 Tax=Fimbriiglobus ruber TaxID=1908690 RepID=A0A225DHV4_9BACT|nr:hypothetical protein FRUB_04904 [Fimbriiglobus ruber]
MSADRNVFEWLRHRPVGRTDRATVYYTLTKTDGMYPIRMRWVAGALTSGVPSG